MTVKKLTYLFLSSTLALSSPLMANVLVINGNNQVIYPFNGSDSATTGGVQFKTDNQLSVPAAKNIGATSGVSVIVDTPTIGEILFLGGTNTILGSVGDQNKPLRLITINSAPPTLVILKGDVNVETISLQGVGSTLEISPGVIVNSNITSQTAGQGIVNTKGNATINGDVGILNGIQSFVLNGNSPDQVNVSGNIKGSVIFRELTSPPDATNSSGNVELIMAPCKFIQGNVTVVTSTVGTDQIGTLSFTGSSHSAATFNNLKQINIQAGTFVLSHGILGATPPGTTVTVFGPSGPAAPAATLLVKENVSIFGKLDNYGVVQIGGVAENGVNVGAKTLTVGSGVFGSTGYVNQNNSELRLFVTNGGGGYSRLSSYGNVDLNQGKLIFDVSGNTIPDNTSLSDVVSAVPITLSPTIIQDTATYKFIPNIISNFSGQALNITVRTTPIATLNNQPILAPLASFFDTIGPSIQTTAPNLVPLYDFLNKQLDQPTLQKALASIAPPLNESMLEMAHFSGSKGAALINDRIAGPCPTRCGQWIELYGENMEQYRGVGTDYKARQWGLIAGYDRKLTKNIHAGAALSYTGSHSRTKDYLSDLSADTYQGFLYGSYDLCPFYLEGVVSVGYNSYDQSRASLFNLPPIIGDCSAIPVIPAISYDFTNPRGRFDGWHFFSYLEAGYPLCTPYLRLIPHMIVRNTYVRTKPFVETGGGVAGFYLDYADRQKTEVGMGFKIIKDIICSKKYSLTPYIKFAALHHFIDTPASLTARFIGGGDSLVFSGSRPAHNSVECSIGLRFNRGTNTYVSLEYEVVTRSGFDRHAAFLQYGVSY